MAETVMLERAGKPSAVVVGEAFRGEINELKDHVWGMPSLEPIIVPYPLGSLEETRDKANNAFPEIIAVLTGRKES